MRGVYTPGQLQTLWSDDRPKLGERIAILPVVQEDLASSLKAETSIKTVEDREEYNKHLALKKNPLSARHHQYVTA